MQRNKDVLNWSCVSTALSGCDEPCSVVGGGLKDRLVATPCRGLDAPHQLTLPRAPSMAMSTSRDGASQLWAAVPLPRCREHRIPS